MSKLTRRNRADAIRILSIDAVQRANSGHPGMPMGMADIAEALWHEELRHNPANPNWANRDRFVLSNGHGCMLLYSLLHLTGYDLSMDDIRAFRQLHSKTPGHPEFGEAPGVETTTGPLGQGLANAVGMAVMEKHLSAVFNRPSYNIVDHYTYCFVGDGCLMEGISHEVCSLAGTLGLGKLIVLYDDNEISIDGDVSGWFTDNTPARFKAYNWHVIEAVDGHDGDSVHTAIKEAQKVTDKPTLICCKSKIGYGSPAKEGSAASHGAPLGDDEIANVRDRLGWPHEPFTVPEDVYGSWNARDKGEALENEWKKLFASYQQEHPALAKEYLRRFAGNKPADWEQQATDLINTLNSKQESMATRKASQQCLNVFAEVLPEMIGGSADLTGSNNTNWTGMQVFSSKTPEGRYLHYGVREFGMSAMMNGMALYGGTIPFAGTFLTFSDYARNAVRLSALMKQRVVYVYTHDSIGLGEDGPTHQPIEHIPSLRLMPGLSNWRPCDTVETAVAWRLALERNGPTCLMLSRQTLPFEKRSDDQIDAIKRGGYVLTDYAENGHAHALIMATGSEVAIAQAAAMALKAEGILVRVISMPSTDTFLAQDDAYKQTVLPAHIPARVAVEAASTVYWHQFVGDKGKVVGIDRFGASAPQKDVYAECGITVENVITQVKEVIYAAANEAHAQQYAQGGVN